MSTTPNNAPTPRHRHARDVEHTAQELAHTQRIDGITRRQLSARHPWHGAPCEVCKAEALLRLPLVTRHALQLWQSLRQTRREGWTTMTHTHKTHIARAASRVEGGW